MIFNTGGGGNATRIVTGKSLHLADTAGGKYKNIKLVGASVQNGTPTVSKPVDIVSNTVKSITGCGKNLLKSTVTTQTVNGITFTVNADKSVTVNGTATADAVLLLTTSTRGEVDLKRLTGKNIILSGCPNGGSNSTYKFQFWSSSKWAVDTGNGATLDLSTIPDTWNLAISIMSGTTVNNLTFKPMIRLASISDDTYEPYASNTAELDQTYELNGINGIYDEIDLERGVKIQRFNSVVLDGSQTMVLNSGSVTGLSGSRRFQITCLSGKACANTSDQVKAKALCDQAIIETGSVTYSARNQDNIFSIESTFVCLRLSGIATADDMKAHLQANPMTVVYELAEPVETPLSVDELIAFKNLRAYKSGSTLISDCDMEVEYFLNNKVGQPMADIHMNTPKYILDGATLNIIV